MPRRSDIGHHIGCRRLARLEIFWKLTSAHARPQEHELEQAWILKRESQVGIQNFAERVFKVWGKRKRCKASRKLCKPRVRQGVQKTLMIGIVPVHRHWRNANCSGHSPDADSGMALLVEDSPRRTGNLFRGPAVSHVYTVYQETFCDKLLSTPRLKRCQIKPRVGRGSSGFRSTPVPIGGKWPRGSRPRPALRCGRRRWQR